MASSIPDPINHEAQMEASHIILSRLYSLICWCYAGLVIGSLLQYFVLQHPLQPIAEDLLWIVPVFAWLYRRDWYKTYHRLDKKSKKK